MERYSELIWAIVIVAVVAFLTAAGVRDCSEAKKAMQSCIEKTGKILECEKAYQR